MELRFRPIIEEDIKTMTDGPTSEVTFAPPSLSERDSFIGGKTVVSGSIFGERNAKSSMYSTEDEFTRVGYIRLKTRIINPYLAGRNYTVWSILTDMQGTMVKDILDYKMVYKVDEKSFYMTEQFKDQIYN